MILTWVAIAIAGMLTAAYGSRRAVAHAAALAQGLRLPPYLVGFLLLALGTDIPEIIHGIIAASTGHGDLALGNAVGSVATNITLALGILGVVGGSYPIGHRRVLPVTLLTMLGLGVVLVLTLDGMMSRRDGAVLVAAWASAAVIVWRVDRPRSESVIEQPAGRPGLQVLMVLGFLGLVGIGAAATVRAVVELAPRLGVPEYVISFFATALGTSMPEIIVEVSALRSGRHDLALGDLLGSCLVDATLAPGIGPLLFPFGITAGLATRGTLIALGGMLLATSLLAGFRRLDRRIGLALLAAYLLMYIGFFPA